MPAVFYNLALAVAFTTGIVLLMQPQRQLFAFMQTLEDVERATTDYIGAHCNALPENATQAALLEAQTLPAGFDTQGAAFSWQLADHPVVSVNVTGDAAYLAFLAQNSLGQFAADGSYTFIPDDDITMYRAANHSYNLFAYAGNDYSCNPL